MSAAMVIILSILLGFFLHFGAQMFAVLVLGVPMPAAMLVMVLTIPLQIILTMGALDRAV